MVSAEWNLVRFHLALLSLLGILTPGEKSATEVRSAEVEATGHTGLEVATVSSPDCAEG